MKLRCGCIVRIMCHLCCPTTRECKDPIPHLRRAAKGEKFMATDLPLVEFRLVQVQRGCRALKKVGRRRSFDKVHRMPIDIRRTVLEDSR